MPEDSNPPADDPNESESPSFESGHEERVAHYPEEGYSLVEIDLGSPPGEALVQLCHYLALSEVIMPPATGFEDYVAYDQHGNAYDHDDLAGDPDATVDTLIEDLQTGGPRVQRLALREFAIRVDDVPGEYLDAVPVLTTLLEDSAPAVRADTLRALARIAAEYPDALPPAADAIVACLDPAEPSTTRHDAVDAIAAIAEPNPGAVVDAAPSLAALLQDEADADVETTAITALQRIAAEYPDAVVPVAGQLTGYLETRAGPRRVGALAVLGLISKEYPDIAADTVSRAIELLEPNSNRVRANAAGLLADLAEEYPERVEPAVPRAIELLDDIDEKARYNATSILARVAEHRPEDVKAAVDPLVDALCDDFEYTRSNACWTLGYLGATDALDRLRNLAETDPSEEVRHAAAVAVDNIESG